MTDGPMVRLAKAVQLAMLERPGDISLGPARVALADLAGTCAACNGNGGEYSHDDEGNHKLPWVPCPTCTGTGTDPLAKAREADAMLAQHTKAYREAMVRRD